MPYFSWKLLQPVQISPLFTIQIAETAICMLNKGDFCVCIIQSNPLKIALRQINEGSVMGYDENRAAKPFAGTPYHLVRYLWRRYKRWQLRQETRAILSRLNDAQLKDIGLRRDDWKA